MAEPPAWMKPDWDPNSAKVPELRMILLENNVHHSASRKGDLINLFEDKVRPETPTLLKRFRKVQPSANGIIDAETGQQIEQTPATSPVKRGRGRPRKTAPAAAAAEDEAAFGDAEEAEVGSPKAKPPKAKASTRKPKATPAAAAAGTESDADEAPPAPAARKRGRPPKTPGQAEPSTAPTSAKTPAFLQGGPDALDRLDEHARSNMLPKASGEMSSVKRKKTPDVKADETASEVEKPKEKRRKKKVPGDEVKKATGLDSGPESGFSDFNPFQSGAEDSPEQPEKKARRKSSAMPKSATTGDLRLDAKPRASTSRPSLGDGSAHPPVVFGTPSSAPRGVVPTSSSRAASFVNQRHMARLSGPPPVSTPDEVARQLIPDPDFGADDDLGGSYIPQSSEGSSPSRPVQARKALAPITKKRVSLSELVSSPTRIVSRTRAPTSKIALLTQLALLGSLLGGFAFWRHEKLALGFCDTGLSSNSKTRDAKGAEYLRFGYADDSLGGLAISTVDAFGLRPSCIPCPSHAVCGLGQFVMCSHDYVRKENPLGVGGVFPVAPKCVPDTEKLIKVAEEAVGVAKVLRAKRGEVVCKGEWSGKGGAAADEARTYGLSEDALRAMAASGRKSPYGDLFALALDDLETHGQVVVSRDPRGLRHVAAKTADLTVACRAKLGAIAWAKRQTMPIATVLAAIGLFAWLRFKMQSRRESEARVRALVNEVFDRLTNQAVQHSIDPVSTPAPYLAPAQLRDSILAEHHSAAVRKQNWKGVERVVEGNANVRIRQAEHRGENLRVWEWIGSWSDSPRKSIGGSAPGSNKRVSFGGAVAHDSPSTYPSLHR